MKYILTYLVFPLEGEKEVEVRCWLDGAHFPNFIDRVNGRIVALNLSVGMIEKFVEQFDIASWECGQNSFPEEYEEVCKTVNNTIAENAKCYHRFASQEPVCRPMETSSDIYQLLSAAYLHDGYRAWRLRYYLSANCLGRSVETLQHDKYLGDPTLPQSIGRLRRSIQTQLDDVAEDLALTGNPDLMPVADVWVDRNPFTGLIGRMYVGWFSKSFNHFPSAGNFERFTNVTPMMNDRLRKLGIPRNTESPDVINNFVKRTKYLDFNLLNWEAQPMNPDCGIVSTVVIPYLECEDPEKVLPVWGVPYAIGRVRHKILLFNIHRSLTDWLKKLKGTSLLRRAFFSYDRLPEYADLYDYMERKIESNLSGTRITKHTVRDACPGRGMSAYYCRMRCFAGLMGLDPNNLPEYGR